MNKKILIGSIIAVVTLLLMPSIPAVQQKAIVDKAYDDFVEKIGKINLINENDITPNEDRIKHPLLLCFIRYMGAFRLIRGLIYMLFSSNYPALYVPLEIYYPIIYERGEWLWSSGFEWFYFWYSIAYKMDWNWPDL